MTEREQKIAHHVFVRTLQAFAATCEQHGIDVRSLARTMISDPDAAACLNDEIEEWLAEQEQPGERVLTPEDDEWRAI